MILATVFFFVVGYAGFWRFSWMAYPVGGLFCGMVALIFQGQQEGACIPYMHIEDFPSIPARGLYYDDIGCGFVIRLLRLKAGV